MRFFVAKLLLLSLFTSHLHATTNEDIGDVLQILLPATAYATTLYLDDEEGEVQFYQAYGYTLLATYALKYTVNEKRPDTDATDSFPSGHTSSAFSGASFIHARYGWKYAIIPYIGATFTAYSRVDANRHYVHDVIAGAALASLSSWYFTTEYNNLSVSPIVSEEFKGLTLSYKF